MHTITLKNLNVGPLWSVEHSTARTLCSRLECNNTNCTLPHGRLHTSTGNEGLTTLTVKHFRTFRSVIHPYGENKFRTICSVIEMK